MAWRALRLCERHGRFKQRLFYAHPVSDLRQCRMMQPPWLRQSQSLVESTAAPPLLILTRSICSTALRPHQYPSEIEDGEKKKPMLGLNFLSKLFGRSQEPAPVAAEESALAEEQEGGEVLEDGQLAEAYVEGEALENGQVYVEEGGGMLAEGEAAVEDGHLVQVEGVVEDGQLVQGEAVLEDGQLAQGEAVVEDGQLVQGETVVEQGLAEAPVMHEKPFEESLKAAAAVEMEAKAASAKVTDISTSVEELLRNLPPILPAGEAVAASVEKPEALKSKAAEEKPKVADEKPKEKPKVAPEKPKPVAEKPKPVPEKPNTVQEKPKPVSAPKKPVDAQPAAAAAEKKPAASKKPTASSPATDKPSPKSSSEPMINFLRTKIGDGSAATGSAAEKAAPSKPPPIKPSARLEAMSSQANADKTTAAINMILESMDKSAKSPAAPIFDALDALNAKEKPAAAPAAPSLRLSLSTAPAEPAPMDRQALMAEMNNRLTDQKPEEAVTLFENWRSSIDPHTMECNKPDRALYNLYMQAKLKVLATYDNLLEIVTEMEEAGMPRDLAGYNILIRALFRKKNSAAAEHAEQIIETMEKEEPQAQPDADSYNLVAVLCALERKVVAAKNYMKKMIDKGFEPSRTTVNEILIAAARSHQTHLAASILKEIKASGRLPMPLLNTCAELMMAGSEVDDAECTRLALAAISERPMAKFGPKMILDEGTMICVLGTAARTRDAVLCNKAWEALSTHTRSIGKVPSPEAFHARIHALTCIGDVTTAFKSVWEFELNHGRSKDLDPETFSPFTSLRPLASACSRGGAAALDAVYYKLEEAHTKKQGVALAAINCVILGCGNLWDSERAFQTFEAIENVFGLRPDIHSCNALMYALGRTKLTEDALKVYDYIKEAGFKPDKWTYMLLSDAHVVNHDANSAIDILQTMIENGQHPFRQTTLKVWTRCRQHDDNAASERLSQLEQNLNYRQASVFHARRKLLLDVLRS